MVNWDTQALQAGSIKGQQEPPYCQTGAALHSHALAGGHRAQARWSLTQCNATGRQWRPKHDMLHGAAKHTAAARWQARGQSPGRGRTHGREVQGARSSLTSAMGWITMRNPPDTRNTCLPWALSAATSSGMPGLICRSRRAWDAQLFATKETGLHACEYQHPPSLQLYGESEAHTGAATNSQLPYTATRQYWQAVQCCYSNDKTQVMVQAARAARMACHACHPDAAWSGSMALRPKHSAALRGCPPWGGVPPGSAPGRPLRGASPRAGLPGHPGTAQCRPWPCADD